MLKMTTISCNDLFATLLEIDQANKDKYTEKILRKRYLEYYDAHINLSEIIKSTNLPIRHQNPPEDITENITKFIIRNYDNDVSCKWSKAINIKGDLCSDKYNMIEVKAFTSNGPLQFGPKKKFDILYLLDLRKWLDDKLILYKVNIDNNSPIIKNIKVNKLQTHEDQCKEGRRPHISFDKLFPQIQSHCEKIYEGSFEDIFISKQQPALLLT